MYIIKLNNSYHSNFVYMTENIDFVKISNANVTFQAGDLNNARRCIENVTINDDAVVENNETFNLVLTKDSDRLEIDSSSNVTEVTILEDDDDCKYYIKNISFRVLQIFFPIILKNVIMYNYSYNYDCNNHDDTA